MHDYLEKVEIWSYLIMSVSLIFNIDSLKPFQRKAKNIIIISSEDRINMCLNSMLTLKELVKIGYYEEKLGMVLSMSTIYLLNPD